MSLLNIDGSVIAVIIPIVIIALLFAYATSRVKVAGANEALVRTGGVFGGQPSQLKVVRAGRVIVLPLVHKLGRLDLSARQINISLTDAVTKQGIKCMVQGVATVKIGGDEESIRNAAERFLDRDLLDSIVKNVLEGSLRSIVGTLTVEELNYDRQKFQQEVQGAAKADLATSGLAIDNFTIQAIRDEVGYMDLIGQQETARRERDARMAKATADQEATVREAEAQQIKLNAQRDVALRQADVEAQTASAQARASQAGPLAQAEAQQEVVKRQTELANLEADRKKQELVASTIRPAEAEAEAQVRRAEGDKGARIAAAQAEAERVKLAGQAEASVQVVKGEAQARVTEVNAEAVAKQTTLEGNAEAGITFTKGEAEAKALALRAEAYRQFNEAAIISTVLSMLPEIVRAAAEPIGNIESLTVLSSEGATDVVKTATRTVAEASTTVKGLTGIDIPELLSNALGGSAKAEHPAAAARTVQRKRRDDGDEGGSGEPGGAGGSGGSGGSGGPGGAPAGGSSGEPPAPAGGEASTAGSAGTAATASVTARPTPAAQPTPAERFEAAAKEIEAARTRSAVPKAEALAGLTSPMPPLPPVSDLRPGDSRRIVTGAASAVGLDESSTLSESAQRLAEELKRIPGIDRFGGTRLRDLEQSGPRTLRTLWSAARDELSSRYGDVTIGTLLDAYEGQRHDAGSPPR